MVIDPGTLAAFIAAAVALILIPGPNVMFIVTQSVTGGRRAGLISALGVEVGSIAHVTAAVLGLSALIASSTAAIAVIKYGGAAYLVFLGIRVLRSGESLPAAHGGIPSTHGARSRLFVNGFLINLFNPKVALFFVAFLPQFVDPARGSVAAQLAALGLVFCVVGLVGDCTYAVISGAGGEWLRGRGAFARRQRYITAAVYFGLAAVALTARTERPAPHR